MTKEEIKALIDAKIAGQGSAVDAGSALPAILNGILELAANGGERTVIEFDETFTGKSLQYALERTKVNGNRVSSIEEVKRAINRNAIIKIPTEFPAYEFYVVYTYENVGVFEVGGGLYIDGYWGGSVNIVLRKDDTESCLIQVIEA